MSGSLIYVLDRSSGEILSVHAFVAVRRLQNHGRGIERRNEILEPRCFSERLAPRQRLDWHAAATVAAWFMTLIIQRAEHRDPPGHSCKDELLRAEGPARNELTLDDEEPESIETHRSQHRDRPK
jgi:hypothetical protein